jgi:MYXO-CTERM domain-containing protein
VGTWYRIGIVNYNGTNNFYINGVAVGTDTLGGTFSQPTLGFAQGGINGGAGGYDEWNVWSFNHNTDSLASVASTMNAVPEPAAALLGSLGMLALLRRRR